MKQHVIDMCLIVICEFGGFIIWQVGLWLIAWVGMGGLCNTYRTEAVMVRAQSPI